MDRDYLLMHKNNICGILRIDADNGAITDYKSEEKNYSPFLGNTDLRLMKIWWKHRAVPGSRSDMTDVIRKAGCDSNALYLAKNLALSLTDCYWICPAEVETFYAAYDFPDVRAEAIARSYENKLQLLSEFQHGKTISIYREKE